MGKATLIYAGIPNLWFGMFAYALAGTPQREFNPKLYIIHFKSYIKVEIQLIDILGYNTLYEEWGFLIWLSI